MKTLPVGEFKARFSEVLRDVQAGHPITITYGKKRIKLAVLVPYGQYGKATERQLGALQGTANYQVRDDFKMTDEEFLTA